jgi:hypothetical protein
MLPNMAVVSGWRNKISVSVSWKAVEKAATEPQLL